MDWKWKVGDEVLVTTITSHQRCEGTVYWVRFVLPDKVGAIGLRFDNELTGTRPETVNA